MLEFQGLRIKLKYALQVIYLIDFYLIYKKIVKTFRVNIFGS
jgi:hypothetical protein